MAQKLEEETNKLKEKGLKGMVLIKQKTLQTKEKIANLKEDANDP